MSFGEDFDDIFENLGIFNEKSMKKIQDEINAILKEVKNGKLGGKWETKEIAEPGLKGWIFMGRFGSDDALEPIDPLKPRPRRPMPEKPFEIPKTANEEIREPLTDVFEEKNAMKVYVELPGEEKEAIQLKVNDDIIEVKAKNFFKKIHLPNNNVSTEKMTREYKNGVLMVTLPKKISLRKEDIEKQRMV